MHIYGCPYHFNSITVLEDVISIFLYVMTKRVESINVAPKFPRFIFGGNFYLINFKKKS